MESTATVHSLLAAAEVYIVAHPVLEASGASAASGGAGTAGMGDGAGAPGPDHPRGKRRGISADGRAKGP